MIDIKFKEDHFMSNDTFNDRVKISLLIGEESIKNDVSSRSIVFVDIKKKIYRKCTDRKNI